jgi:hypothetical protein
MAWFSVFPSSTLSFSLAIPLGDLFLFCFICHSFVYLCLESPAGVSNVSDAGFLLSVEKVLLNVVFPNV